MHFYSDENTEERLSGHCMVAYAQEAICPARQKKVHLSRGRDETSSWLQSGSREGSVELSGVWWSRAMMKLERGAPILITTSHIPQVACKDQ